MIQRTILVVSVAFFCCGFLKSPSHTRIASKTISTYAKRLKQEKGLELIGRGGSINDDIESLTLSFLSTHAVSVEEARTLYVDTAEGLLEKFNTNPEIQPHLHTYPFTMDNIRLSIRFEDENGNEQVGPEKVAYLFTTASGMTYYCGFDPDTHRLVKLFEEPYETARQRSHTSH